MIADCGAREEVRKIEHLPARDDSVSPIPQLSQDNEMPSTTIPRGLEDLLDAKVASLTTLGRGGDPQATLVWFAYNRELARFQLSLSDDRVKARNLIARPRVSLLIFDPADQFRYLMCGEPLGQSQTMGLHGRMRSSLRSTVPTFATSPEPTGW